MTHPFESLPSSTRRYVFLLASALFVIVQIYYWFDRTLENGTARLGIISFELAQTASNAHAILASWGEIGRIHAGFSLGIDYVYILGYANLLAVLCILSHDMLQKRNWPGAAFGILLAWSAWLAGLLDSTENVGLAVQLFNAPSNEWAFLAWFCASIKFILIGLCVAYVLYAMAVRLARRLTERGPEIA